MSNFIKSKMSGSSESEIVDFLDEKLKVQKSELTLLFVGTHDLFEKIEKTVLKNGKNYPQLVVCTTAGEIHSGRVFEPSVVGVSFLGPHLKVEIIELEDLNFLDEEIALKLPAALSRVMQNKIALGENAKSLALLLVDGLSVREEVLTGVLGNFLIDIPLVGGSSGDGVRFQSTKIFSHQKARSNSAVIIFITTTLPFEVFQSQHFEPTEDRLVITKCNPEERIVYEIDGEAAADAYARHLGLNVQEFSPQVFADNPVLLKVGNNFFVRSIQKVNPDKSLTFFCAIDEGLVLRVAKKKPIVDVTSASLELLSKKVPQIECSILFECILRKLEIEDLPTDQIKRINDAYKKIEAIGFNSYGEQINSIHVNHTLTGVAFGS